MIDKTELTRVIEEAIDGTDLFLVQVTVSGDNVINVDLDSESSVDIDQCVMVNDAVLAAFDRDVEDYELTVGSYGITSPLLVRRQYDKNIGEEGFTIEVSTKVKIEGKKRPELQRVPERITYDNAKQTCVDIKI